MLLATKAALNHPAIECFLPLISYGGHCHLFLRVSFLLTNLLNRIAK